MSPIKVTYLLESPIKDKRTPSFFHEILGESTPSPLAAQFKTTPAPLGTTASSGSSMNFKERTVSIPNIIIIINDTLSIFNELIFIK